MKLPLRAFFTKKNLTVSLTVGVLVAAISVAGYFYWQNRQLTAAAQEIKKVTQQVGKLFLLPNEEPTLATVTEKEKLQAQAFFQKSENGDKVLIFPNAKKAILYRPSINKIIEVSPFITNDAAGAVVGQTAQPETAVTTSKPAEVAATELSASATLLNGSSVIGITNQIDDTLKQKFPALRLSAKATAKKTDYKQTIVVDLTGTKQALAQKIASELGGIVGTLPTEEVKPETDLVIIIAKAN